MENSWLPKDERRLLAAYAKTIGKFGKPEEFAAIELVKCLSCRIYWTKGISRQMGVVILKDDKAIQKFRTKAIRVGNANECLKERKLILIGYPFDDVYSVNLTLEGYELGRKYNHFLGWSQLWFAENKTHWIAVSLGALVSGGLLVKYGSALVEWVSKHFK